MPLGRVLAVVLLCHGVIAGPSGPVADQTLPARSAPRKLHGRFLHITDIHPDEYYKVHSSTDEDDGCHRGRGPAGPYGAETSDCDSPFSLVNATFDWIDANLKDNIDFIVWTGDSARHDRDENLPRNADQVLGTNRWIADKFVDMLADKSDKGMTIPVVPNFGNNDILPHNILLPGPNKWFQHYLQIWRHFIPEEQRHSFEFGGWFNVEVIPNKLAVFSLNTLYLFDRNAGVDGCASPSEPGYKQMEWLRVQLQFMRDRGMKAILMGHVPPARTDSKMLWDETCWQKYSLWMHQFRDVVLVGLYGHMNIDHFLIHDKNEINIAALDGSSEFGTREAMDDELTAQSASDYLMELRSDWAKLDPPASGKEVNKEGKRKKGKDRKDPWGERYHLSLVSPSVVPTYFPTLRVFEYNITGLEATPLWRDAAQGGSQGTGSTSQKHIELRQLPTDSNPDFDPDSDLETDDPTVATTRKKHKKGKKKKHGKPKKSPPKDKDPNLHIPLPPSKSAPPGPAYSVQPLTLTGYTQYFANLTHINNLNLTAATHTPDNNGDGRSSSSWWSWRNLDLDLLEWDGWLLRWRKGKHGGKKPVVVPRPTPPREFAFEVEYSTFEDAIYRLGDLTVNSMVGLAVRMGGPAGGKGLVAGGDAADADADPASGEEGEEVCDDDDDDDDDDYDGEAGAEKKKKKGKGKKEKGKKGKKKRQNKTWLHFLRHAFVGTLEKDDLEDFM